ncbi:MAG: energy transducer TonB [Bacteroidales bacterium]|nr:energy transducer TonB [Bacteroidales bacterium]
MDLRGEDKAGLYITVSVHLAVIIVLLLCQISSMSGRQDSFLMDFSASVQEDGEAPELKEPELEEELSFDEEIARRIEKLISGESGNEFRNIVTDRSQALKDDRGTDANKLYEDARRLAQNLKDGVQPDEPEDNYVSDNKPAKKDKQKEYSGPSVVSYNLDGRKASRLPVPAYGCFGGGMVTVIIVVDNSGKVVDAKVQDDTSSKDKCLREKAVNAAKRSRFSTNTKAPARQHGDIVYQFIAQ